MSSRFGFFFFFSSRRRHTRSLRDWSSDVCSSDLGEVGGTAGCSGGHRHSQPQAAGDGGDDRVLCEPAGVEESVEAGAEFPRVAGGSEGDGAGGVCAPGCALREAGGGTGAGTGAEPGAVIPGQAGTSEQAGGRTGEKRVTDTARARCCATSTRPRD